MPTPAQGVSLSHTWLTEATRTPVGFLELPIQKFAPLLGHIRVVDVREPHEFEGELGHLPGAELVPLGELEAQAEAWDREAPLALVCRAGARSGQGAMRLQRMGFTQVVNLSGGMLLWREQGLG